MSIKRNMQRISIDFDSAIEKLKQQKLENSQAKIECEDGTISVDSAILFLTLIKADIQELRKSLPREDILSKQLTSASFLIRDVFIAHDDSIGARRVMSLCDILTEVKVDSKAKLKAKKVSHWLHLRFEQRSDCLLYTSDAADE